MSEVAKLLEKWRSEYHNLTVNYPPSELARVFKECADELEAALREGEARRVRKLVEWLHLKMSAAQNLPYNDGDICEECVEAVREELLPLVIDPPEQEQRYVEGCDLHRIPLIDGQCPKCKDSNGETFVMDMQSKCLIPVAKKGAE